MKTVIIFCLLALSIGSCNEFTKGNKGGALATGKPGEILVVCTDELWNSSELDSLIYALASEEEPYYPIEYKFTFHHKNVLGFNHLHKKVRNILIIEEQKNAQFSPAKMSVIQNKWVKGQTVVEIQFKDKKDLLHLVKYDAGRITKEFEIAEIQRNVHAFTNARMIPLQKRIHSKYGFKCAFPSGSKVLSEKDNFIRIDIPDRSREMKLDGGANYETQRANFILSSLLIWEQPYTSKEQLTKEALLAYQDSILKQYAPHEKKGAYLATEYDSLVYPTMRVFEKDSVYSLEIKGQYRINGRDDIFMGGPFISHSFVHPTTHKIVTLFGLIHGPSEKLINYIREYKAIFETVTIE
jgi:hypothetical protein